MYYPAYERIWDTIRLRDPHAFLILGDNVYLDLPGPVGPFHDYTYYQRQSRPEFRRLVAGTPIYAIWDDHDAGIDDVFLGPYPGPALFGNWSISISSGATGTTRPTGRAPDRSGGLVPHADRRGRVLSCSMGAITAKTLSSRDPSMLGPDQKPGFLTDSQNSDRHLQADCFARSLGG